MSARESGAAPVPPSSRTRRWVLAAVAAGAAAAGVGVALWHYRLGEAQASKLWEQTFTTPDGGTIHLADFRGRPLLVNFWATWCPPCVEEMPLLDRFHAEDGVNDTQIIGIAIDQAEAVRGFLERTPVRYPIAMAGFAGVDLTRELGNSAGGLPFTVVFDADGKIRHRKLGQLTESDLREWI